jgi:tRNA-dihydrouridine synthase
MSAKSRTLRRRRLATRGVPRARRAASTAASAPISTPRIPAERRTIPVTVNTRIGYSENIITDWVKHLLEAEPVAISIHGRTLKQMYKGDADWDAIAAAADIIHQTPTLVLGNGDIKSAADAARKIAASGVDGVLIGRAAYGNPWIFTQKEDVRRAVVDGGLPGRRWIVPEEGIDVMLEHARCFDKMRPDVRYVAMRKHLAWYAQWIPALRTRKKELMQVNSYQDLAKMCEPLL